MKNIQAENIDLENVLFHFSDGDIKSIEEKGLEARIGHNSGGVETHKKVFFSQGISEMLQLVYDLTRVSKDAIDNEKSLSNKKIKYYIIGWENIQNIKMIRSKMHGKMHIT